MRDKFRSRGAIQKKRRSQVNYSLAKAAGNNNGCARELRAPRGCGSGIGSSRGCAINRREISSRGVSIFATRLRRLWLREWAATTLPRLCWKRELLFCERARYSKWPFVAGDVTDPCAFKCAVPLRLSMTNRSVDFGFWRAVCLLPRETPTIPIFFRK